jgi:phosphate acyltransferase
MEALFMAATIVIDAMGNDQGVDPIVRAVGAISLQRRINMILVGDSATIANCLIEIAYDPSFVHIHHAESFVSMDEKPAVALKKKSNTSIEVSCDLIAKGYGDALVSAGNTGAVVLSASKKFQRIARVKKAGLASVYPTEKTHGPKKDPFALILDVGATLHVRSYDLVVFALMGVVYAQIISFNPSPKVALLSNGNEEQKGAPEVVEAHHILKRMKDINFVGNVEGMDIPKGSVDVVVCEGFLGNVVIKMLEGFFDVVRSITNDIQSKKLLWRVGMAMISDRLDQIRNLIDWEEYGGAPLLGLDRVVIKAHGRSGKKAIENSIKVAAKAVEGDLIKNIEIGLEGLDWSEFDKK